MQESEAAKQAGIRAEMERQSRKAHDQLLKLITDHHGDPRDFEQGLYWLTNPAARGPLPLPHRENRRMERTIHLTARSDPFWSPAGKLSWAEIRDIATNALKAQKILSELAKQVNRFRETNAGIMLRRRRPCPAVFRKPMEPPLSEELKEIQDLPNYLKEFKRPSTPELDRRLWTLLAYTHGLTRTRSWHCRLFVQLLKPYDVPHCKTEKTLGKWIERERKRQDTTDITASKKIL